MSDDLEGDGYRGTLAEPVHLRIEAGADGALFDAIAKLPALLDHYAIDANDPERWLHLALALALKHVPGFQLDLPAGDTQRPRGRPALSLQARKRRLDLYLECVRIRVLNPSLSWDSAAEEAIAALEAERGFDAHDTGDAGREARRGRADLLNALGISKDEWKAAVPSRRPETSLCEFLMLLSEEQAETYIRTFLAVFLTKLQQVAQSDEIKALSVDDLFKLIRVVNKVVGEPE